MNSQPLLKRSQISLVQELIKLTKGNRKTQKMFQRDLDLGKKWQVLLKTLEINLGKKPADLNGVLFLIGVQELGRGQQNFSKEEKQDLIHLGICKVLSLSGYYELEGLDKEGWPHWILIKQLPHFKLNEQEKLLKISVLDYFTTEIPYLNED